MFGDYCAQEHPLYSREVEAKAMGSGTFDATKAISNYHEEKTTRI